ncbi:organic cation transporter protein-like [Mytilus galloprovincialis]|uniref:organic cation transporter protein-like n=1 Tax=Mytilus galloprovincialis TaxID=29158 RepID=UPI003F7C2DE7
MAHYIGLLVGSILCGFLSDIIGRKPVLVLGIMSMLIAVVTRPFVPSLEMVTFLEFINGFGSMVSYLVPFVLLTELVGPKMRLFGSFCVYLGFCVGLYLLLILVYFIREWELLMWAIGVPIGIFALVVIFFLDESPRWLISRGKMEKAMQSLKTIAKVNNMTLSLSVKDITIKDERTATFTQFLKELIKSKSLLWRLTIVSLNWFALNLVYYGISMNVAKFGGDLFVNYAASSSAELLAILFCWYTTNKIGRKKLFCTVMILGGVTCTSTIFTYLYANESQTWLTTSLAMIGKFFVSIAFFVVYMFTAELFPTVLRASSLGFASMTGRLGAISSAYIAELGTLIPSKFGSALPLIVYGVVGLTGGILSLYLPETTDIILPEYVNDAININRPEQNSQKSDGGEKSSVNNESQNGITYF